MSGNQALRNRKIALWPSKAPAGGTCVQGGTDRGESVRDRPQRKCLGGVLGTLNTQSVDERDSRVTSVWEAGGSHFSSTDAEAAG